MKNWIVTYIDNGQEVTVKVYCKREDISKKVKFREIVRVYEQRSER